MQNLMKSVIFLVVVFFGISCSSEFTFDYDIKNSTEFLTVTPTSLSLSNEKQDGVITLQYDTDKLFLLDVDTSLLTTSFEIDKNFTPYECLKNIQISKSCSFKVTYSPPDNKSHAGIIILKFSYLTDQEAKGFKEHIIQIRGSNPIQAPDNSTNIPTDTPADTPTDTTQDGNNQVDNATPAP